MSRRSSRLASGGYYHSDEESDSSSITTISYRENPVKVFKKKGGPRKKRAEHYMSPVSSTETTEKQQQEAPSLGWSTVSRPAIRSPACVSAAACPSPPSVPQPSSVPRPPSQSPSVSQVLHFSEPSQSTVDSSGYSSFEGPCWRPSSKGGPPSHPCPRADYREWMSRAISRLRAAAKEVVAAVQSRVVQQTHSANASPRTWMKTLCGLLLLLLLLAVWFLWPRWTLFAVSFMKGPSWAVDSQAPGPLPNTALDAAAVSAAVEAKMQYILEEMQLRYEQLVAELKQQVQVDLQIFRQTGLSELDLRLEQQQAQRESSAAGLSVRLSAVEEQLSRVVQRAVTPSAPPLLSPELEQAMEMWLTQRHQDHHTATEKGSCGNCGRPLADKMPDFALESQGASVVSTRCSETYRTRSACVTLFGLPLWYPSESPRTVIQGPSVLLPGKCWAFHGVQGTLVIALSHPVKISHVTLDHLPHYNSPTGRIDSAPRDFQVYGMKNETEEGTLLGLFTYQEDGEPTQTFSLPSPTDDVYHVVELRVLSNWGHIQYTCVYRFRVHGQMVQT